MFTTEEKALIRSLGMTFDFDSMTDDDWFDVERKVSDKLCYEGFEDDYSLTPIGVVCKSILDKVPL